MIFKPFKKGIFLNVLYFLLHNCRERQEKYFGTVLKTFHQHKDPSKQLCMVADLAGGFL